jgi:hypothetical protein
MLDRIKGIGREKNWTQRCLVFCGVVLDMMRSILSAGNARTFRRDIWRILYNHVDIGIRTLDYP